VEHRVETVDVARHVTVRHLVVVGRRHSSCRPRTAHGVRATWAPGSTTGACGWTSHTVAPPLLTRRYVHTAWTMRRHRGSSVIVSLTQSEWNVCNITTQRLAENNTWRCLVICSV